MSAIVTSSAAKLPANELEVAESWSLIRTLRLAFRLQPLTPLAEWLIMSTLVYPLPFTQVLPPLMLVGDPPLLGLPNAKPKVGVKVPVTPVGSCAKPWYVVSTTVEDEPPG